MKLVFGFVALVMLAGCATSPVSLKDAEPVAPDRLYITRAPTANDGTITVIRDSGFMGHGCRVTIKLDGKKAAFIGAGEKASFPGSAGKHMLSVEASHKGLCSIDASSTQRSLIFTIKAGQTLEFRLGLAGGGAVVFYQKNM